MQKALLRALLAPGEQLKSAQNQLDFTTRLVVTEEIKDLPYSAVWEEFCNRKGVATGQTLAAELARYQTSVEGRS